MIDQIIDSLRDPDLARRFRALMERTRPSSPNQPSDHVELSATGHLRFELYNKDGETIDVIEQQNMLTDRALGMLTEIFASDFDLSLDPPSPDEDAFGFEYRVSVPSDLNTLHLVPTDNPRTLYRHQIQRQSGSSWVHLRYEYHNDMEQRHGQGQRTLFDTQFNKNPIYLRGAIIRCIGIGDGLGNEFDIADPSSDLNGTWSILEDESARFGSRAVTDKENSSVTIRFFGTELSGIFTTMDNGANIEISMPDNGDFQTKTISLYSEDTKYRQVVELVSGLEEGEHTLVIRHTGTGDLDGQSSYVLSFEGHMADGLSPSLNRLFREIPHTTNKIESPEIYNTSNRAPYNFFLRRGNLGIVPGSEKVMVDGEPMVRVSVTPTLDNQYFIDYETGEIRCARPISGVAVTYSTAEEFQTGYTRAFVQRPKPGDSDYPFYNVDTAIAYFSADFPPGVPDYPIVVREVGLFDGSENNPLARMFSIVRPPEITKDLDTGLRITWEIQLKEQEDAS